MFSPSLLLLLAAASYVHVEELTQPASMTVQPGQSLSIHCKVSYSVTSYYSYWIQQPAGQTLEWIGYICRDGSTYYSEKLKTKFSISRDTATNTITIQGQNLQTEGTAVYYCVRYTQVDLCHCDYAFDYWGKGTTVTVTSAVPSAPKSLFPVWQCGSSPDGYVTLGCITSDLATADGLSFKWTDASGSALTDFVQYPAVRATGGFTSVSNARVKAADWDQSKKFTCEVKNSLGSKEATLQKIAQPVTEPNITISITTSDDIVRLLCWLDGFRPNKVNVEWYKGEELLQEKSILKVFEASSKGEKMFAALCELSINTEQWNEGTEFTCQATHNSKTFKQTWSKCKAHPTSKPLIRLEKPRLVSVLTDSEVTVSCVVETMFNIQVSWLVDGKKKKDKTSTKETRLGKTVSNLTISTADWKTVQKITCIAKHPCFNKVEETIDTTEPVQRTPTVVIRRILTDGEKGDSAVLVCAARDLPSGELAITLQANEAKLSDAQYVDLPKGQDTLTARFTVSKTTQSKDQRYTCQIQQSSTNKWESNSTGNIFGDPSVELSVVSTVDKSASKTQKLLCSGTGLNPKIKWLPKSVLNDLREVTVQADGRVKVSSEISLPQQEWNNGGEFTCEVSDQDHKPVQKSTSVCAVTPASALMAQVYLLGPSISDTRAKDLVPVTCLLLGRRLKDFSIIWKVGKDNYSQNAITQTPKEHSNGTQSVQSILNVPAAEWEKDTTVSCEVKHLCSKNAQQHDISKTRAQPVTEPNITISIMTADNIVHLLCWLDGFRPKEVKVEWYKGEELLQEKSTLKVFEASSKGEKMFAALCELSINTGQWNEGTEFTCQATHNSKTFKQTWSKCKAHPTSKPLIRLEKPRLVSVLTDSEVTVSCVVETMFNTQVSWLVDGKEKKDTMSTEETRLGKTVSNLTISTADWKTMQKITCIAKHPCFNKVEEIINTTEPVQKTPTVVIRRILTDGEKGDSAVLVCAARDLPSGELAVTLQANEAKLSDTQYVDLPKGQDTLTARFTVSKTTRSKDQRYTCQIQQSSTNKWESNSTGNIFGDPSVELSVVSSVDKSASKTQKLLCSGTGLNPKIKWLPKSVLNDLREVTVQADGRVKVSSEISLPQQEWNNGGEFTCEVSDQDHKPVQKSTSVCAVTPVSAPMAQVYLLGPSISDMRAKDLVPVTCLLLGRRLKDFSIIWKVGKDNYSQNATTQTPKEHSNGTQSVQSVLNVPAAEWEKDSTVSCEVQHLCSKNAQQHNISKTRASVNKHPPSVELLQGRDELVCLVYGFSPSAINITWLLNGMSVQREDNTSSSAKGPDGKFSIKSHLNVQAAERAPGATYTCHVTHVTGTINRSISKTEFIEETIYFDENKSETSTLDQAEETWNMACAFIILFVISLVYGCSVTLVKVKTA
ncbi:uncharacterized protein LOC132868329 [Neoarius graeffei]|uniref:uncharacterized protein LOC132868329 n=1 Tax=Neoarius graeffei TaxID=443677 RepID=UPI00298CD81F|nr:uncharacterized protein LOC132868329 [Neoarius graeffei]